MRRAKAPRTSRVDRQRVVALTQRDRDLMTLVGLCRYLALPQAARELFPNADRARRRVRALFNAGYVQLTLTSGSEPNLISLSRLGLATIQSLVPRELGERLALGGPLRLASVPHRLAITDVRLYAARLGERSGAPLTRWSLAGGDLGHERGLTALHLCPDGLAEFRSANRSRYVAAEVDCSTESLRVLESKLMKYGEARAAYLIDELWIVVIGGSERCRHLRSLVERTGLAGWAIVMAHQHVVVRPVTPPGT